jgi:hypothetical protein
MIESFKGEKSAAGHLELGRLFTEDNFPLFPHDFPMICCIYLHMQSLDAPGL